MKGKVLVIDGSGEEKVEVENLMEYSEGVVEGKMEFEREI